MNLMSNDSYNQYPPLPRVQVHSHDVAADDAGVDVVVPEGEGFGTLWEDLQI